MDIIELIFSSWAAVAGLVIFLWLLIKGVMMLRFLMKDEGD